MNISIIEDDVAIGFSLRLALEDRGHEVEVYTDPAAVPYMELKADVILVDFYMPHMNGAEVVAMVRKNPALNDVKLVLMSASPHMQGVASSLQVVHLPKPFDLNALYAIVEAP